MKLNEIAVEYHKTLNSKLWKDEILIPEVRISLIKIANKFIEFLNIDNSFIQDVIITGSNCNYNWTKHSDLDLHIVLNYKEFQNSCHIVDVEEMFKTKKSLWNTDHSITIYDIPVELYVQNSEGNDSVDGVSYSIVQNSWLKFPQKITHVDVDNKAIMSKYNAFVDEINNIIQNKVDDELKINTLMDKISTMRKNGLSKIGEFSIENLVYKKLRKSGLMDKLYSYAGKVEDENLSLD